MHIQYRISFNLEKNDALIFINITRSPKIKRFDHEAVSNRFKTTLSTYDKWKSIQKDGAADQLIEALSVPLAEHARYGEYLLQELKWDTCRNFSSAKHMGALVGKKLDRKHSAVGTIIVSHSDIEGNSRVSFLGDSIFDIDQESNYDNGSLDETMKENFFKRTLTPWLDTKVYTIPIGATFKTSSGIPFVCAEQKTIKTWMQKWSSIEGDVEKIEAFRASGGWNGYKYLIVPVVQGEQIETFIGTSDGKGAQTFTLATLDVEAADSYYTKQFCYMTVENEDGTISTWKEIQHLSTAYPTDKVFEIDILDDISGTIIKFGDGTKGAIPSKNAKLYFHYLSTKGEDGNISDLYVFNNEINGVEIPQDTNYKNLAIGCQNMWPIIGGSSFEKFKDYKKNAETAYAKNYEILHTYTELLDAINRVSPIPLIKVKTSEYYEKVLINETKIWRSTIGVTGLSTSMEPLTTIEENVFNLVANSNINSKVLSNKSIKYLKPEILKLDSDVILELKNPIVSNAEFEEGLQTSLINRIGKPNLETLDCYMQSEVIKQCLDYSDNIGSIQASTLLTFDYTALNYGFRELESNPYLIVEFKLPSLEMDKFSREGFCNKGLADGIEIPFVFNININSNPYTYVVIEQNSDEEVSQRMETFSTDSYSFFPLEKDTAKYTIKELLKEKHTFSENELANQSSLNVVKDTSTWGYENILFYVDRDKNTMSATLFLPLKAAASCLGYKDLEKLNIQKVYSTFVSSLENHLSSITLSIVPTDKTISSDWNTIVYYDNITVSIDG